MKQAVSEAAQFSTEKIAASASPPIDPSPDTRLKPFIDIVQGAPVPMFLEDMSLVRNAIEALKPEDRNNLQSYFENANQEVLRLASLVRILAVNMECIRLFSAKSPDDLLVRIDTFFTEMSTSVFASELVALMSGATEVRIEMPAIGADGAHRVFDVSVRIPEGFESSWECVYLVFHEVTLAKSILEKVKNSEEQYRQLTETLPDGIILHREGLIVYVNCAAVQLLGATSTDQLLGIGLGTILYLDNSDNPVDPFSLSPAGDGKKATHLKLRRNDGNIISVEIRVQRVRVGEKTYTQILLRDLSESQKAALEQARLSAIVEQMREGVLIENLEGRIIYANPAFTLLCGNGPNELLGRTAEEFGMGVAWSEPQYKARAGSNSPFIGIWLGTQSLKCRDGSHKDLEARVAPVCSSNGKVMSYVTMCRDMSEERALQAQLRQAQKLEAVGTLAGGVAHDFNNILTAMMMNLGLLEERNDLPHTAIALTKELLSETERAANLTRQLLLYSRRGVIRMQTVDLNEVVSGLLKMLRRLIGEQINLVFDSASNLPPIIADAGMVEQVLMNLAVNARDAMPKGGKLVVKSEFISYTDNFPEGRISGHYVLLQVSDTGSGIPPEIHRAIFEPFFTTKEAGRGTGLGLATVKSIMSQHNGWIEVKSEPGSGSTFSAYFPASSVPTENKPAHPTDSTRREIRKGIVLLVEDETSVRAALAESLRSLGYKVVTACNGHEALQKIAMNSLNLDILVTDHVMPGEISGIDLAELLRGSNPNLAVVVVSGYCDQQEVGGINLSERGYVFLEKPCSRNALDQAVLNAITQRTGRSESPPSPRSDV